MAFFAFADFRLKGWCPQARAVAAIFSTMSSPDSNSSTVRVVSSRATTAPCFGCRAGQRQHGVWQLGQRRRRPLGVGGMGGIIPSPPQRACRRELDTFHLAAVATLHVPAAVPSLLDLVVPAPSREPGWLATQLVGGLVCADSLPNSCQGRRALLPEDQIRSQPIHTNLRRTMASCLALNTRTAATCTDTLPYSRAGRRRCRQVRFAGLARQRHHSGRRLVHLYRWTRASRSRLRPLGQPLQP